MTPTTGALEAARAAYRASVDDHREAIQEHNAVVEILDATPPGGADPAVLRQAYGLAVAVEAEAMIARREALTELCRLMA
jgi:hypothetical protein